jgi:hypothetical protein
MSDEVFERQLEPCAAEILEIVYRRFVEASRAAGAVPVWVFLPTLEIRGDSAGIAWMVELAVQAGFEVVDLSDVWEGEDLFTLRVADWDYHPNTRGHRLVADRLYEELARRPGPVSRALAGAATP